VALAAHAGRSATPEQCAGNACCDASATHWLAFFALFSSLLFFAFFGVRRCARAPPQVASSILARMGYARVTQARDGQEALDHIAARGGPDAFDFILMDLHMPRKARPARGRASAGRRWRSSCVRWLSAPHRVRRTMCRFCLLQRALHQCTDFEWTSEASETLYVKVRWQRARPGHHHSAKQARQEARSRQAPRS
jgi:hypothetical protein